MTVSPVASPAKIQTALANLGTPDGFIAYDIVPLLQQLVVALGNISTSGGSGALTGEIKIWSTSTAPSGYLICDGSAVSRTTYASLFAVIGTTYGAGDSSTTFNLPQLGGKVPLGYEAVGTYTTIGGALGETTFALPSLTTNSTGAQGGSDFNAVTSVDYSTTPASVEVIQPSIVLNFIIKT